MGYLSNINGEIVVDAILTKKGREKIAKAQSLGITKFDISDSDIDYSLFDLGNPMGTDFYDIAVERMPILEPSYAESINNRSRLYSSPGDAFTQNIQMGVNLNTINLVRSTTNSWYPGSPVLIEGLVGKGRYITILPHFDGLVFDGVKFNIGVVFNDGSESTFNKIYKNIYIEDFSTFNATTQITSQPAFDLGGISVSSAAVLYISDLSKLNDDEYCTIKIDVQVINSKNEVVGTMFGDKPIIITADRYTNVAANSYWA